MGKYEHAYNEIQNIEREIKMDYERNYENLTNAEQEQVLLDHFFKGDVKYNISATKLRIALDGYISDEIEDTDSVEKIKYKNGKTHYKIRQKNGRFGKWIRE